MCTVLCVEVEREIKNHSPWPAVAAGVVEVAMARQQPKHLDVEREIGKFVVVVVVRSFCVMENSNKGMGVERAEIS